MENLNNNVVEKLAKDKVVEGYLKLLGKNEDPDNLEDLKQDIYLTILEMDEVKLQKLVDNNKINDFVFIMIKNNILSKNSPYYYKYKKNLNNTITLEDYEHEQQGDD